MFSDGVSRFPGTMTEEEQGSEPSQSESRAGTQEGKTEDEKTRAKRQDQAAEEFRARTKQKVAERLNRIT